MLYTTAEFLSPFGYVGETERKWQTRKGEHEDKVRLTKADVELGKKEAAEKRMNTGDGGLARHAVACISGISWENAEIVGREQRWRAIRAIRAP